MNCGPNMEVILKNVSMASWNFGHVLGTGDKKISAEGMWVEPAFPKMFSFKMLKGSFIGAYRILHQFY